MKWIRAFLTFVLLATACGPARGESLHDRPRWTRRMRVDENAAQREGACGVGYGCDGRESENERPPPTRTPPSAISRAQSPPISPREPHLLAQTTSDPSSGPCNSGRDCPTGFLCVAENTGCPSAKVCKRATECSSDYVAHCSCDAETFFASSGCSVHAYAHQGACETVGEPAEAIELDEGATVCTSNAECGRGRRCFGIEGCTTAWTCERVRDCPRDSVPFCSCNGETFHASSGCPGRPFKHMGACASSPTPTQAPTP